MDAKMNIKVFFIHGKDIKLISGKKITIYENFHIVII
jgi:hypothetical protein